MRWTKPRIIGTWLAAVAVVSLSAIGWWFWRPGEPSYGGHRLSYWASRYEVDRNAGLYMPFRLSDESARVVRTMGTNTIPTLLRWMTRPRNGLTAKLLKVVSSSGTPAIIRKALAPIAYRYYRPDLTLLVFRVLGSDAAPAIPELLKKLYWPGDSPWAVLALCAIGPKGEAALEQAIPEIPDGILRANAVCSLEHGITAQSENSYARFLAQELTNDSFAAVRMEAARILGNLTNSPDQAMSALVRAGEDRDGGVRAVAARSLRNFGPQAPSR